MTKNISRRSFVKKSARAGLSVLIGGSVLPGIYKTASAGNPDTEKAAISVVTGENYFTNTLKAVELVGGMKKFVSKNATVGILVNSSFEKPGTFVSPEIVLATMKMCYEAGAKHIVLIKKASDKYWGRNSLSEKYPDEIKSLKFGTDHVKVDIQNGKKLKEAQVIKELLETDVFINIPITKNHSGTNFTGTMKNMMGATSRKTNGFFHFGVNAPNPKNPYADVEFLSQCIADVNLLRKPDLCITDATEFIITNGPFGPGKITKPRQVIAGIDRIAVDAYCATLLGLEGKNILMLKHGVKHGLGELNLDKFTIIKQKA